MKTRHSGDCDWFTRSKICTCGFFHHLIANTDSDLYEENARDIFVHNENLNIVSDQGCANQYFISSDNSSHWYIIPESYRKEWDDWCNLDEDDERSWDAPSFAEAIGGPPSQIIFINPKNRKSGQR